jgi:hypothetical protein
MHGLWILITVLATVGAEARCEIGWPLVLSEGANVAMLVTATAERASAGVPDDPDFHGVQALEVAAWRFRVEEAVVAGGALPDLSTVLVVPWGYDAGCFMLVWDDDWVPAGDSAVFIFSRDQLTGGGEPVVHVLGWHGPFPHGLHHRGGVDRGGPEDWLSAGEYLSLLRALPVRRSDTPRELWVREVLREFENGPPEWSERYPGTSILRMVGGTPPPRPIGGAPENHR